MTTLEAMLDAVVEPARPHDPALLDARAAVLATRGVLGARVRARAAAFARAGIEPGTAVAFGVRQDADGIAWLLGAIRAGLAVVIDLPARGQPGNAGLVGEAGRRGAAGRVVRAGSAGHGHQVGGDGTARVVLRPRRGQGREGHCVVGFGCEGDVLEVRIHLKQPGLEAS